MDVVNNILTGKICPNCKRGVLVDLGYWNCDNCQFECSHEDLERYKQGRMKIDKTQKWPTLVHN